MTGERAIPVPVQRASARQLLTYLIEQGDAIMSHLSVLQAEVQKTRLVNESAIVLLTGISERMQELKEDPAAIQALADELRESSSALAAAVQANALPPETPQA